MADISKINGVPIANIEKLDAVLAANIAKVNGLVFSTAAAFLLDTYTGAAAAYSVRRLATAATVLMRVRRDTAGGTGDDDEADVAYDSNNELSLDSAISNASAGVTATTLGEFINVGTVGGTTYSNPDSLTVTASCFTDTWYDQSGNANHAEQATQANQPQIHSGTVNTDLILENGKPAVEFDGSNDWMNNGIDLNLTTSTSYSFFLTGKPESQKKVALNLSDNVAIAAISYGRTTGEFHATLYTGSTALSKSGLHTINTSGVVSSYYDFSANTVDLYVNGNQLTGTNGGEGGQGGSYIGQQSAGLKTWDGIIQEIIIYTSDQSSNRTGIETNINGFFSIYP